MSISKSNKDIIFRSLKEEDLSEIKILQKLLFPVHYSDKFYHELLYGNKYQCILAYHVSNKKVIGICTGTFMKEEAFFYGFYTYGYISTLGIHPTYQRLKIGTTLLMKMEQLLSKLQPSITQITLHVKIDNKKAIQMYQKLLYTIKQKCNNHYLINQKHHHAYLLSKELQYYKSKKQQELLKCVIL